MIVDSCVYHGHVYHKRWRPTVHSFRYAVFSMYLNVDKLHELASKMHLFSHNRWNVFSFHDRDFNDPASPSLRSYVERHLQQNQIDVKPASIHLLCYPRMFGYSFNPLAVFYCADDKGRICAVLHQVSNTFGERELYVFPVEHGAAGSPDKGSVRSELGVNGNRGRTILDDQNADNQLITQCCSKRMHVSPFTPMNMQYQFRLNQPCDSLSLTINANDREGLMLTASIDGTRKHLTDLLLFKYILLYPLMTLKVIAGIHWEALRLWLKRVPWFSHKPKLETTGLNSTGSESPEVGERKHWSVETESLESKSRETNLVDKRKMESKSGDTESMENSK